MAEPSKFTDKATELAGQAAEKAGPVIDMAKEVVTELVEKAGPLIAKAGEVTAQGISVAAEQLDRATGGKYSDKLSSASTKIEDKLDRGDTKP